MHSPRVCVPAAVAAAAGHAAVPRTAGFGIGREADQRGAGLPVVRLRHTFGVAAGQGTIRAVRLEARGWSADTQRYLRRMARAGVSVVVIDGRLVSQADRASAVRLPGTRSGPGAGAGS
jgi:hypothetical protein